MGGGGEERDRDGSKSVRDLRIAEVLRQDIDGRATAVQLNYRVRLAISFKYDAS